MKVHSESDFLAWVKARGIVVDAPHPDYPALAFQGTSPEARFWVVPDAPERRSFFMTSLLDLMGDWRSCWVWRHCGAWPSREHLDAGRINDCVELVILEGVGVPLGTSDVVEFNRDESDRLVTLLFSTSIFGWSVGEDLYLVPDHGRYILKTDHHGVVHVEFQNVQDIGAWVSGMSERGFTLPDDPPDETFKPSSWMAEKSE